jgi:hypothetical protein
MKFAMTNGIKARVFAALNQPSLNVVQLHDLAMASLEREINGLSIKPRKTREEWATLGVSQGAWNVLGMFDAESAPITWQAWVESFLKDTERQ